MVNAGELKFITGSQAKRLQKSSGFCSDHYLAAQFSRNSYKKNEGGFQMLQVTDTAKEKFVEFINEEKKEDAYVRIYVSGVG